MKFRATCFVMLLCLMSLPMFGQAKVETTADPPAAPEDIRKLFDVMQIRSQMKLVMQQVYQQMRAMERDQMKNRKPDATDEDMAKLDAISEEVLGGLSVDGMLDDMIPVYQKHLTKSDVNAMIGFYSTPTGQKILREMPAMTSEGMQAMQPRLRKMIDDANAQVEKKLREQIKEENEKTGKPDAVKN